MKYLIIILLITSCCVTKETQIKEPFSELSPWKSLPEAEITQFGFGGWRDTLPDGRIVILRGIPCPENRPGCAVFHYRADTIAGKIVNVNKK